jgi:hypothetical protein
MLRKHPDGAGATGVRVLVLTTTVVVVVKVVVVVGVVVYALSVFVHCTGFMKTYHGCSCRSRKYGFGGKISLRRQR